MRQFINLVEGLTNHMPLEDRAREFDTEKAFVKSLDSTFHDVLYRGHGGDEPRNNSFMTDYVGHAEDYGEEIDAYEYSHDDLMNFTDDQFDKMRSHYRRMEVDELRAEYQAALVGQAFGEEFTDSFRIIKGAINSDKPFKAFSQNFNLTNALVPLMQKYAQEHGKNIICFLGGDYGDYGGQNEFVVSDISKLRDLKALYRSVHGE